MIAFIVIALFLNKHVNSQSVSQLSNVIITIFSTTNLPLYVDTHSKYYPNDYYIDTEFTSTLLYTLGSNNIIQVY